MDFTMYPFDSHVCTFQVGSCKFLAFSQAGLHRCKAWVLFRFLQHQLDDVQLGAVRPVPGDGHRGEEPAAPHRLEEPQPGEDRGQTHLR